MTHRLMIDSHYVYHAYLWSRVSGLKNTFGFYAILSKSDTAKNVMLVIIIM